MLGAAYAKAAIDRRILVAKYSVRGQVSSRVRIALFSDLHSTGSVDLAGMALRIKPDIIALAGDMIDDWRSPGDTLARLGELAKVAPTFYVCGNHESWRRDRDEVFAALEEAGINVLHNRAVTVDSAGGRVVICGVPDPEFTASTRGSLPFMSRAPENKSRKLWKTQLCRTALEADALAENGEPRILISHRPEYSGNGGLFSHLPIDIILSGHAHGGHITLPFLPNGLYSSGQGLFPAFSCGLHKITRSESNDRRGDASPIYHFITRGLDRMFWRPRTFNKRDVVVVDIVPTYN